ncbi:MAG: hypothetical protein V9E94_04100 [Microthrixaceae bacterium]
MTDAIREHDRRPSNAPRDARRRRSTRACSTMQQQAFELVVDGMTTVEDVHPQRLRTGRRARRAADRRNCLPAKRELGQGADAARRCRSAGRRSRLPTRPAGPTGGPVAAGRRTVASRSTADR